MEKFRGFTQAMKQKKTLLEEDDKKYLWHPFTQMKDWLGEDILVIERGEGVYLFDTRGNRYLDGVSSLWCNVHGHQVPEIDRALRSQLKKISHTTFLGLSNVPAIELGRELVRIAPKGLKRVFYSDSGSEAVEIAAKIAYQYWQHLGWKDKIRFIKLTHAYHGDTLGSVSLGGIELFHEIYRPLLFETFSAPAPYCYRWPGTSDPVAVRDAALLGLEEILKAHHEEIAALIMEPLMQGAAGMIDQPEGYISRARELTKKYNVLLIFDEVATGFGRTGKMFASDHERVSPDLLAAAKGLTGGYLPLAVTLATEEIFEAFLGEYVEYKTFFHGHTYTANPLACRAALASLELFEKRKILEKMPVKIERIQERLRDFYGLGIVGDIRQAGFMIGIELVKNRETKEPFGPGEKIGTRVIRKARDKGAILRPLGPVIVLMPPLSASEDDLEKLLAITYEAIKETEAESAGAGR